MLTLAHPDVFHYAICFGGYYHAAPHAPQAENAWRPWGDDTAAIDAHSPVLQAATVPDDQKSQLFFFITGYPSQPFFGPEYTQFVAALDAAHIAYQTIQTPSAHSWPAVNADLPSALQAISQQQAARSGSPRG